MDEGCRWCTIMAGSRRLELEIISLAGWNDSTVAEQIVLRTAGIFVEEVVESETPLLDTARTFHCPVHLTFGIIRTELKDILRSSGCQINKS